MSLCPGSPADSPSSEKPLEGVLKNVIKNLGGKERLSEEEIAAAWAEAAGGDAAKHSRPVSFRGGTVFVNVDRSGWLYEITTRKKEILGVLESRLKGRKVKDIRLRIGDIENKRG
jgi:predicted nucleic acid-binding Zn ribbon protein